MKILQIVHSFIPYNFAGTEVYTYNLAKELSQNNDVFILHRINNPLRKEYELSECSFEGLKIFTINNTLKDYTFELTYKNSSIDDKIIEVINRVNPDIIHIQHLLFLSAAFLEKIKKMNIPVVFTINDYWYCCPRGQLLKEDLTICNNVNPNNCLSCLSYLLGVNEVISRCYRLLKNNIPQGLFHNLKRLYLELTSNKLFLEDKLKRLKERRLYLRDILSYADMVIFPSEFVRSLYIKFGINLDKTILIKYGVRNLAKGNYKSHSKNLRFGYIGSLLPSKGVHVLIEAFNKVKGYDLELVIYGEMVESGFYSDYCALLKRKAVNKAIRFSGGFSRENLSKIFDEIDVLIVPSIWHENCPNVILEALAFKVPAIASRIGGIPELIEDGVTGLLFNVGDADDLYNKIKIFADNRDFINNISLNIKPPVDIKEHAKSIEKLYLDIKNKCPDIKSKSFDYNFENLYRMNFTQQYNKEVNLYIANILEKAIKQIILFKKELNLISIMLTGSFSFEEGSVISNDGGIKIISDFDLVLVMEEEIARELEKQISEEIHLRFKENNLSHYKFSLCFTPLDSINKKGDWTLYNLRQKKQVLWGNDVFSGRIKDISNHEAEKFELTSTRRIFGNFAGGFPELLSVNFYNEYPSYLYLYRPLIRCCMILVSLAGKYTGSYLKMNDIFKEVFPTRFPELFQELPYLVDLFDKVIRQKLDPNKEILDGAIDDLWQQVTRAYLKIFEFYLNRHYGTHNIEIEKIFIKFINDKSETGWLDLRHKSSLYKLSLLWSEHFRKLSIRSGKFLNHINILKLEDFVSPQYIFYNAMFYLLLYLFKNDEHYLELTKKYLSKIVYLKKQESLNNILAKIFECRQIIHFQ